MGKGIDFGSFKSKKQGSKTGEFSSKNTRTKKTHRKGSSPLSGGNLVDLINGGTSIVSQFINLSQTINEQRNMTLREKENTKRIQIEVDKELETLSLQLKFKADEMQKDLEKYKADIQLKMNELDSNTNLQLKELELQKFSLELAHKEKMRMIDLLKDTMNMYTDYYSRKVNGEEIPGADFILQEFGSLIGNMKLFMNTLSNNTGRSVQCDYTIE